MTKSIGISVITSLILSACAGGYAGSDYTPVIDVQQSGRANNRNYDSDLSYCQSLASQRSVLTAGGQSGAVSAIVGAGIGALGGVLVGGGNVAEGALIGAAGSALSVGTYRAIQANSAKQDIVMNCMRERGWRVVAR